MLIVVRSLAHHSEFCPTEEYDERELSQVDLMDAPEELLPHTWICCRKFLLVEGIQFRIAVEVNIVLSFGRDLIARQHVGIVGVITIAVRKLGDVISARYGSRGRRCLPA